MPKPRPEQTHAVATPNAAGGSRTGRALLIVSMLSLLFTAMLAAGFWPWPIVLGPYVVVGPLCRHVELKNVDFSIASPPRRRWRSYDITRHLVFPLPPGRHLVSPPNWSLGPYRVIKTD